MIVLVHENHDKISARYLAMVLTVQIICSFRVSKYLPSIPLNKSKYCVFFSFEKMIIFLPIDEMAFMMYST